MSLRSAGLVLGMALLGGAGSPSVLARFTDHARVLVISAPEGVDPELRRQEAALGGSRAALSERAVVVIKVIGAMATDERGAPINAAGLRAAVGLSAERFGVALVGKDGGVKLRREKAVTTRELVETIDAMPMRREEMRAATPRTAGR